MPFATYVISPYQGEKEKDILRVFDGLQLIKESKEEVLPGVTFDFPYLASYVEFSKYTRTYTSWHWHKEVELFYIEKGSLEYYTPQGKVIFPERSGGIINSNVLHMTRQPVNEKSTIQKLHIFDPALIGGRPGSLAEQKYIRPFITSPSIEILGFYEGQHEEILEKIRNSFKVNKEDFAYEIKLNETLSGIWYHLLQIAQTLPQEKKANAKVNEKLKTMINYIHEHYDQKLAVEEIARAAFISERECYRSFKEHMRITPVEYLNNYRLQIACHLLANGRESITFISNACGLGSSSYFGKIFRENFGCTPAEYRQKWQNNDNNCR